MTDHAHLKTLAEKAPPMTDRTDRLPWLTDELLRQTIIAADPGLRGWDVHMASPFDLEQARAVLVAACPEPTTWQPIDSAPADGRWLLVWQDGSRYPAVARWFDDWKCLVFANGMEVDVEHGIQWQPLPAPPSAGGEP